MNSKSHAHLSDLAGLTRVVTDVTTEVTSLAEMLHRNIAHTNGIVGIPMERPTSSIAQAVYSSVRGVTRLVGGVTDRILTQCSPSLDEGSSLEREAALAALNGVMGDYLAATGNPLAISMQLRRDGQPLMVHRDSAPGMILDNALLDSTLPPAPSVPRNKLLVLVHGLCMNDLQWTRKGSDIAAALARDLGYTPVHLHYNSGLHTSTNGRAFAGLLEGLLRQWPHKLKDFVILAHSMGGLVARSAYRYATAAGLAWPQQLRKLIFLGTPHHGSLLERGGNWIDIGLGMNPYTAPFARLAKIRSAGITDLRYGNLLDEDWQGIDRFEHTADLRHPVPLPESVQCYAIAAKLGKKSSDLLIDGILADGIGDGIVHVNSALGRHHDPRMALTFAPSRQWIGTGLNHWDLLSSPAVYDVIRGWLTPKRAYGNVRSQHHAMQGR
jgi:pimeloyl-ACP methyl ester carboxylesterase